MLNLILSKSADRKLSLDSTHDQIEQEKCKTHTQNAFKTHPKVTPMSSQSDLNMTQNDPKMFSKRS